MSDHPNHTLQVFDSEEYKDGGWEHIKRNPIIGCGLQLAREAFKVLSLSNSEKETMSICLEHCADIIL